MLFNQVHHFRIYHVKCPSAASSEYFTHILCTFLLSLWIDGLLLFFLFRKICLVPITIDSWRGDCNALLRWYWAYFPNPLRELRDEDNIVEDKEDVEEVKLWLESMLMLSWHIHIVSLLAAKHEMKLRRTGSHQGLFIPFHSYPFFLLHYSTRLLCTV